MKKVMLVFGTRPEAIKMCPVVEEIVNREGFEPCVCVTGQHKEMLEQVLRVFGTKVDYDLAIMKQGQTLFDVTSEVLTKLKAILEKEQPDIVLVHGDTTTTFAASLASFYLGIPVGHVEAGLRTYNMRSPFPEEFNRQSVGLVAQMHFAPTRQAADNLIKEGKDESNIYITGNTSIDALKKTVSVEYQSEIIDWAKDSRLIVLTAHRRENLGEPLHHMFKAIRRIVDEFEDVKVVYPIHMNPAVREVANAHLANHARVRLIEPLEVVDFHNLLAASYMILTDSGGIQEEAPSLGKPVLVMRDTTERPEGVEAGTLKLVGTSEEVIYEEFKKLLMNKEVYEQMSQANNPYGDGFASKYIVDALEQAL